MKLKTSITLVTFLISFITLGQSNTDNQLYSTTNHEIVLNKEPKKSLLTEKKWRKTKRQLKRNKKKFTARKNAIHTSKTIDTIYLNVPLKKNETRLSDW